MIDINDREVTEALEVFAGISDECWEAVKGFSSQAAYIGDQLTRALDSIGANLAEGFGRETPGSVAQFYRYAQGSALESVWWLERATERKLLPKRDGKRLILYMQEGLRQITALLNSIRKKGQ